VLRRRFRFRKSSTIKSVLRSVLGPRQTTGLKDERAHLEAQNDHERVFELAKELEKVLDTLPAEQRKIRGRGIPRHADIGRPLSLAVSALALVRWRPA
jgi:hypothetical protein